MKGPANYRPAFQRFELASQAMPPRPTPKKDAVLAIGLDKPTAEIIAAAKAKGVVVSGTYVDLLKKGTSSGRPKGAAKKAPKKAAAKKVKPAKGAAKKPATKTAAAKPASKGKAMTKADYVRSLGPAMMPAAIMEQAKRDGVKLTIAYVYNLRKGVKKAAKNGATAAAPVKRGPGRPPKNASVASGAPKRGPGRPRKAAASLVSASSKVTNAQVFRKLVLELGVSQARHLVDEVATKLAAIVSG